MRHFILGLLALLAVMGAACAQPEPMPTPAPTPTPAPEIFSIPEGTDSQQPPDGSQELLATALRTPFTGNSLALQQMGDSGDASYIPVLVEFLRFPWLFNQETMVTVFSSLAKLIGQPQGQIATEQIDWEWWVEWLADHPEIRPPAGYAAWKGRWFSLLVDPEMGAFLYDGVKARIRLEEIVWGGVPKDGIPDLTNPPVISAKEATYLNSSDRVFGVSINGEHRAYPLRILNPHEMANDVVGGVPFALAY